MGLLIEASALTDAHMIFDCRFSLTDKQAGRQAFEAGHIPGAQYADLEVHLSDLSRNTPRGGGRHPLPDRETFAELLREWGINQESEIVCYDQNIGPYAARMWWMLRWLGHDRVYVLDGGLDAWLAAGNEATTDTATFAPGNFTAGEALTRQVEADTLLEGGRVLYDARDAVRFSGREDTVDPVAGHIPGAIHLPFTDNVAAGRFKSRDALIDRFAGIDADADNVCYCGSGVTATHNILAMMIAGLPEPALYAGSWSDWITDPDRPVATDI